MFWLLIVLLILAVAAAIAGYPIISVPLLLISVFIAYKLARKVPKRKVP